LPIPGASPALGVCADGWFHAPPSISVGFAVRESEAGDDGAEIVKDFPIPNGRHEVRLAQ
jgi:hypothetical protein